MNEDAAILKIPCTSDCAQLSAREWLITNGQGGYASGTIAGVPTRRYHGLLIPDLPSPLGRTVLIQHLEETVTTPEGKTFLTGREETEGNFINEGPRYLQEFRLEWMMPVWEFKIGNSSIQKKILMPENQNTVYVNYTLLEGPAVTLELRPYLTFRGHDDAFADHAEHWPFSITLKKNRFELKPDNGAFALKIVVRPFGIFTSEEKNSLFFYRIEKNRGLDDNASSWSPGFFTVPLAPGKQAGFLASTESWDYLPDNFEPLVRNEKTRLKKLMSLPKFPLKTSFQSKLILSADEFIVQPGNRIAEIRMVEAAGEHVRTVIAGYPWFTDWGRDTMISLEGLCLCTGRHEEARNILRTFANYIRNGLIPNHFPEGNNSAIYNTADATLWYFHALDRYLEHTGDQETLRLLFPLLTSILAHHEKGTDYGIRRDPNDGLLHAGAENYALTWMDAKAGDWVVTPRRGKPVEIQALWYNALRLMADWAGICEPTAQRHFIQLAETAYSSFNQKFWNASGKYLFDIVDGEKGNDASFRPNQVFSLSLRYPVLKEEYAKPMLEAVHARLMTPYGLRTLDPADKNFIPRYEGNRIARDGAYHQGLVWPWLTGHFYNAWRHVHYDTGVFKDFFEAMEEHLTHGGTGSISEIFDAEEPFTPRGCIAQAWSVAEVLRMLWVENNAGPSPHTDYEVVQWKTSGA